MRNASMVLVPAEFIVCITIQSDRGNKMHLSQCGGLLCVTPASETFNTPWFSCFQLFNRQFKDTAAQMQPIILGDLESVKAFM